MTEDDKVAVAEMHSRIDRMEVTLSHAVDAIEKMATVLNKPQETKWGAILTAVGLLVMAGAGYTTLVTMPMQREADKIQIELINMRTRELTYQRTLGRIEGVLEIEVD